MQSTPSSLLWNKSQKILLADAILALLLLLILPFDPMVNKGLVLLVFIGVLWLTEALNVTVTALLVPILAIAMGLTDTRKALVAFADPTIFLFFGGFALATALHMQQLDRLIAGKIMALTKGNLLLAVIFLFLVTAFLSMWMSNTATTAMMLPLAMGVLSNLDRRQKHNTFVFVLLGIAYSASIGGMGTLVGSPPNAIVASQLHLTFAQWMSYGLPIMILLLPIMIGALYLVFRPKFEQSFQFEFEQVKLTPPRLITLAIFVFIAVCWIFSGQVNPLLASLLGLNGKIVSFDSVIALLAAVLICISRVATWQQIQENTEWGVLMLFGGGLTLSAVLKDSGASKVMADGIVFLIQGGHFYLIGVAVAAFIIFLTEFTSNTASAALLVPIFISIAEALGMPTIGLALIIGLGASCAFMLPVATPPNAIVFATGQIKQREMVRAGVFLNLFCVFFIASYAYLFWL